MDESSIPQLRDHKDIVGLVHKDRPGHNGLRWCTSKCEFARDTRCRPTSPETLRRHQGCRPSVRWNLRGISNAQGTSLDHSSQIDSRNPRGNPVGLAIHPRKSDPPGTSWGHPNRLGKSYPYPRSIGLDHSSQLDSRYPEGNSWGFSFRISSGYPQGTSWGCPIRLGKSYRLGTLLRNSIRLGKSDPQGIWLRNSIRLGSRYPQGIGLDHSNPSCSSGPQGIGLVAPSHPSRISPLGISHIPTWSLRRKNPSYMVRNDQLSFGYIHTPTSRNMV
jgi:hypothetical protein